MGRKQKNHEPVMDEIFGAWEWHIFQHLQSADRMIAKASEEATMFGVPAPYRRDYIRNKIVDMIDQIAERRENEGNNKPSLWRVSV